MIIQKYNKPTDKIQQYDDNLKKWLNPDTGNWVKRLKSEKHKANQKVYKKAYRVVNRDEIKATSKEYYEANRDKIKATSKVYYEANRTKAKSTNKVYREANRDDTLLDLKKHKIYTIILTKINHKDLIYIGQTTQSLNKRLSNHKSRPTTTKPSQIRVYLDKGYIIKSHNLELQDLNRKNALAIEIMMIRQQILDKRFYDCINVAQNRK